MDDSARDDRVFARNPQIQGPMHAFGYSYLEDKLGAEATASLRLPNHNTAYGDGRKFEYEALNLVDGARSVSDIRDWLVAELGLVPLAYVAEYLLALQSINVVKHVSKGEDR